MTNKPMICDNCKEETYIINVDADHRKVCDDCNRLLPFTLVCNMCKKEFNGHGHMDICPDCYMLIST